jgi:hypothetical protein
MLLGFVAAASSGDGLAATGHSAPAQFADRVNQYVELHRVLAAPLGPEALCADAEMIQRGTDALARAIRDARPTARRGNIFIPIVAAYFRGEIAIVVRDTGVDVGALLDEMEEEGRFEDALAEQPLLEVNGTFPWEAGNIMWPSMLWRLPALPEELEYRFVGRDLVLLDVRANLVVDVLDDALPGPLDRRPATRGPCVAHPELAGCWT